MSDNFKIRIVSDVDYEGMVIDICENDNTVAMINDENGRDNIEIIIYPPPQKQSCWRFPLRDFLKIIKFAENSLIEENKI